jgi:hypothetical protein
MPDSKEAPRRAGCSIQTTTSAVKPSAKRQKKEVSKKSVALEGGSEVRSYVTHGHLSSCFVPLSSVKGAETPPAKKKQRNLKKDADSDPKRSSPGRFQLVRLVATM